uniref:2-oxo-4-hydroxy-4-carboxy-5-ureidoimidazoline decarboxylase n=1 Tax=Globisporangium ultimum (strain ATCC 200006 / CBS 805.95 / DAOM BR144) TaxID=431595 RepID=K3W7Q4_GLOUD
MALDDLNRAAAAADAQRHDSALFQSLLYCCGSRAWVSKLLQRFPFADFDALCRASDEVEKELSREDWLEAFGAHPRIGRAKQPIKEWEAQEQKATKNAAEAVLDRLEELNNQYYETFGYIYIVCATGKSAEEMLQILESRVGNNSDDELKIAAAEQSKITKLRLEKLLVQATKHPSRL